MNIFRFISLVVDLQKNKFPKLEKIEKMGLLGVRIAQEYSRRVDLLDEDMCNYLRKVHSSLIKIEQKNLLTVIEKGSVVLSAMEYFDNEPFAYTYITQVYRGTLKNGMDISIKVLNPKAKVQFEKELQTLVKRTHWLKKIAPETSKKLLTEEIFLNIEENNMKKLCLQCEIETTNFLEKTRKNYEMKYFLKNLKFPNILPNISTAEYLVGEFIYGRNVKDLLDEIKMKYNHLLEIMRYHFFYVFIIGKYHSDIHAGNIIIGEDSKVYFIDCNSLTEIDDDFRKTFFNFLYNISIKEYGMAGRYLMKLSTSEIKGDQYNKIVEKLNIVFHDAHNKNVREINFTKKIMEAMKFVTVYGLTYSENLFSLIKALTCLEEMSSKTMPNAIFIKDIKKILEIYKDSERLL
ncbi:MAG: AarF/UbiB family protein [Fusobacteriaceae bacterium]